MRLGLKAKLVIIIAVLGAVYICAYVPLSLLGKYYPLTVPGGQEWTIWYPKACCERKVLRHGKVIDEFTAVGKFFAPLVVLDRRLFHKTRLSYSVLGDGEVLD